MSTATGYPSALTVDARGLACPMPIIKARKGLDAIAVGQVLAVLATDKGAPADFRSWCLQTDQKFLGVTEAAGYFRLQVLKVVPATREPVRLHPHELSNEQLAARIQSGSAPLILDVREAHEYAAGHIPGALHLPIDQLESGLTALSPDAEIAVICRTGRRSDYACQVIAQQGAGRVWNVVPGMSAWPGPLAR